jgi:hypothetical protein
MPQLIETLCTQKHGELSGWGQNRKMCEPRTPEPISVGDDVIPRFTELIVALQTMIEYLHNG